MIEAETCEGGRSWLGLGLWLWLGLGLGLGLNVEVVAVQVAVGDDGKAQVVREEGLRDGGEMYGDIGRCNGDVGEVRERRGLGPYISLHLRDHTEILGVFLRLRPRTSTAYLQSRGDTITWRCGRDVGRYGEI